MLQSFIGAVVGGFIGFFAGALAANTNLRADFQLLAMIGLGSGTIVGSTIGSTGAIIHAIKKGESSG